MMLKALSACDDNTDLILDTFSSIHGPWSMAYYQVRELNYKVLSMLLLIA